MTKFVSRTAVAVLSLALAACDDPFGGGRVPVRLTVMERAAPEFALSSATAGTVTIRGTFGFSPCDELDPTARLEQNTLVFRLEMDGSGDGCLQGLLFRSYLAEVRNLDPGSYHVRVEHVGTTDEWDGVTRPDGVRFEGDVTVQ